MDNFPPSLSNSYFQRSITGKKDLFSKNNFDNINEHKDSISSDSTEITKKYFIIPYFNKISEKFKTITQKFDFNIAYKSMNCLNTFKNRRR